MSKHYFLTDYTPHRLPPSHDVTSRRYDYNNSILNVRRTYISPSTNQNSPSPSGSNTDSLILKRRYEDALHRRKEEHRKRIHKLEKAHLENLEEKDVTIRSLKQLVRELERNLDLQTECNSSNGRRQSPLVIPPTGGSQCVHTLLEQVHRLQTDRERTMIRLTALEMKATESKAMDTSFESVASCDTTTDHDKFSDVESIVSDCSLSVSMESLHSIGTVGGFSVPMFCSTDTEKELEQTKRRELSLEGEILGGKCHSTPTKQLPSHQGHQGHDLLVGCVYCFAIKTGQKHKDDNFRLRQKVAALEGQIHSFNSDPNSTPDFLSADSNNVPIVSSSDSDLMTSGARPLSRDTPSRASLIVRDRRISTLESQIEFLKNQVALKTEQIVMAEFKLKDKEWAEEKVNIDEMKKQKEEVARLTKQLAAMSKLVLKVNGEFRSLKEAYALLRQEVYRMTPMVISETVRTRAQIDHSLSIVGEKNSDILEKYLREMKLRKKYHNDLVELRGNIRVFCRVRPRIKEDGNDRNELVVSHDPDDDGLVKVNNSKGRSQHFDLDKAFGIDCTQCQVFNEAAALVRSVMDGYNVCIFAYGQTGSGKTYTMEGPQADPGINQRALRLLFEETRDINWNYEINAGVLEIYNETIKDLLNPDTSNKLEVKMKTEGGYHVPGLSTMAVNSVQDVNKVFEIGRRNRAVAATNLNEHSSRSHCLLCVTVRGTNATTGLTSLGRLNLVDLAGSERLSKSHASGARLKEAQNINRSLACLGDVIHALRNKHNHVPYRNSKLTYLLQDSLGGDSKTLMIVQVSPVEKNLPETLCSLSFAQRVKTVELGQATNRLLESGTHKAQVSPTSPTPLSPKLGKPTEKRQSPKVKSDPPAFKFSARPHYLGLPLPLH